MTDAREIIARFFAEYHDRSRVDGCDMEDAEAIIEALAGFRILGPDEVEDVRRVVEIANRNEWSAEGDRLVRFLGRKA